MVVLGVGAGSVSDSACWGAGMGGGGGSTSKGRGRSGGKGKPSKMVVTWKLPVPLPLQGLNMRYTLDRVAVHSLQKSASVVLLDATAAAGKMMGSGGVRASKRGRAMWPRMPGRAGQWDSMCCGSRTWHCRRSGTTPRSSMQEGRGTRKGPP